MKSSENMKPIVLSVYDCDGTLNNIDGQTQVTSTAYQEMVVRPVLEASINELKNVIDKDQREHNALLEKLYAGVADEDKNKIMILFEKVIAQCEGDTEPVRKGKVPVPDALVELNNIMGTSEAESNVLFNFTKIMGYMPGLATFERNLRDNRNKIEKQQALLSELGKKESEEPFGWLKSEQYLNGSTDLILAQMEKYERDNGKKHPNFVLQEDAVAQIKFEINDQNQKHKDYVVSRNVTEFIHALLLHNGLSKDELDKIGTVDARALQSFARPSKGAAVADIVSKEKKAGNVVEKFHGYDDSPDDLQSIGRGIAVLGSAFRDDVGKCELHGEKTGGFVFDRHKKASQAENTSAYGGSSPVLFRHSNESSSNKNNNNNNNNANEQLPRSPRPGEK